MDTGDDGVVDVARRDARLLEGFGDGLLGQRCVSRLAEALLPEVGMVVTRLAVAVEKLLRRRSPTEEVEQRRAVRRVQKGDGAVTSTGLVGPAGKSGAEVGQH